MLSTVQEHLTADGYGHGFGKGYFACCRNCHCHGKETNLDFPHEEGQQQGIQADHETFGNVVDEDNEPGAEEVHSFPEVHTDAETGPFQSEVIVSERYKVDEKERNQYAEKMEEENAGDVENGVDEGSKEILFAV